MYPYGNEVGGGLEFYGLPRCIWVNIDSTFTGYLPAFQAA